MSRAPLGSLATFFGLSLLAAGCGGGGGASPASASSAAPITSGPAPVTSFAFGGLTPARGSFQGGSELTLQGTGFQAGLNVWFDGAPAAEVVVVSSNTALIKTPPHAPGLVDLTLAQGVSRVVRAAAFEFTSDATRAEGLLDTSFAGRGFVTQDLKGAGTSTSYDYLYGVAVDGQGRIVAVGESTLGRGGSTNRDMIALRFLADGTPDLSFGVRGRVTHAGAAGGVDDWDKAEAVAIDALGRIVICGRSYNQGSPGDSDLVVWRLLENGSLDVSFGGRGYLIHDSAAGGQGWDSGQALAFDALGRIVVAGYSSLALQSGQVLRDRQAAVWRVLEDGRLDPSFGRLGVTILSSTTSDEAYGVAVDARGRILVAGEAGDGTAQDVALWRLDDTGRLDTTFGNGGLATHHDAAGGGGADAGYALALDAQGRALVAGRSVAAGGGTAMVVWCFDEDGALDPAFAARGFALLDDPAGTPNASDTAYGIAIEPRTGQVAVVGNAVGKTAFDATVWLLQPSGATETRFGTQGVFQHDGAAGGPGTDQARALTFDAQGRIVIAGSSASSGADSDLALWRLR